ncbi:hypothetical protein [Microaceticoccus formicicus]|uniref:hypothetical protein n=1 Tax=Microaceticoccus formicicus TaxID=3118105 RepID=UPI003CD02EE0|nr:hypothetical protein VZL98_04825 [Peptoniphilaceae bacterium AMB_02]
MNQNNEYQKVKTAENVLVIRTIVTIGEGTEENPSRYCYQYWSLEGELLAERDTIK